MRAIYAFGLFFAATLLLQGAAGDAGRARAAEENFISIGTGGVTGVYYPAGGAICRLVNRGRREHGFRCAVESTDGSEFNINTIRAGQMDFGVTQADLQYYAYNGMANFANLGPFTDLRTVVALHSEPYTLVARADTGITRFEDLRGKRVNVGPPGSGGRNTTDVVLAAFGWTSDVFALQSELKAAEQGQALCDGNVDAIVYVVGHPNGSIQEATTTCDSRVVTVAGDPVDRLLTENAFYRKRVIPGGIYTGNPEDVQTFGVRATLVSSAQVSDDAVYTLVKSVFDSFEDFKRVHPVFERLTEQEMITDGVFAPLHDGAVRYYRERGWMP